MADKKNIQAQKEYNSLMEVTQSMLGKITKSMEDVEKSADGRNKKLKEQISLTREVLSGVKSEQDLVTAIQLLRGENNKISKTDYGINQELSKVFMAQSDAVSGILQKHKDSQKILDQVGTRVDSVKEKFNGIVDSISDGLGEIPLIGKTLSNVFQPMADKSKRMFNVIGEKFKTGFGKSFTDTLGKGESIGKAVQSGIGGGFSAASKMAARFAGMLGPIGIAVLAIAAGLALGLKRFQELDAAALSFRNETGLLVSQTRGMQENIRATNIEFANLGVSAEDVSKAASEFVNEFQGIEQPSQAVLGSMVTLNKNFGVGISEATKLNKVFQNIGDLTAEQSQALIGQTVEMAKMAGVAPSQVIDDMAKSSEVAYKYFQGSPAELAKAAVSAAKLGTSIEEAGKAADNLLDFQSSISSELEASAMLGVNLNLGQARYLAANGKVLESQQAILDEVDKIGDISKLNVYEQEALAKATGMEYSSLLNQQRIRERFGSLSKEQLAAATSLVDAGKDINSLTEADLKMQTQRLKSQQDMQSTMGAIQNEAGALKTGFTDMMAPIAGFVLNNLLDGLKMIGTILMPLMKGIGSVARIIFGVLGAVNDVIMAILGPIFAIGGAILDFILKPFSILADLLQPLFDKFKELKAATMEAVQPILDVFRSLGDAMGDMVGNGPLGYFIDFLSWGLDQIISLIGFVGKAIAFILKPIMAVIGYLVQGISFVAGLINDYLIQPLVSGFNYVVDAVVSVFTYISDLIQTYLIDPIMYFVNGIGSIFSAVGSFFGLGGDGEESTTSTESINDGVVQNGQVVSTDPADFLLATKNPQGLAEDLSGGGGVNISMDGVIAELQSLKEAFLSNKDVYMDKTLVSATVTDTQERSGRQNRFGLQGA